MVMDGKISRNAKIRIIRDGVVVHAELSAWNVLKMMLKK
jgi:translation initiation factor IF-2